MKPLHRTTRSRRRGFLSMELALTLPILMLLLLATLEFAMLFSAWGTVVEASFGDFASDKHAGQGHSDSIPG